MGFTRWNLKKNPVPEPEPVKNRFQKPVKINVLIKPFPLIPILVLLKVTIHKNPVPEPDPVKNRFQKPVKINVLIKTFPLIPLLVLLKVTIHEKQGSRTGSGL